MMSSEASWAVIAGTVCAVLAGAFILCRASRQIDAALERAFKP